MNDEKEGYSVSKVGKSGNKVIKSTLHEHQLPLCARLINIVSLALVNPFFFGDLCVCERERERKRKRKRKREKDKTQQEIININFSLVFTSSPPHNFQHFKNFFLFSFFFYSYFYFYFYFFPIFSLCSSIPITLTILLS